jgi:hypothetical protein
MFWLSRSGIQILNSALRQPAQRFIALGTSRPYARTCTHIHTNCQLNTRNHARTRTQPSCHTHSLNCACTALLLSLSVAKAALVIHAAARLCCRLPVDSLTAAFCTVAICGPQVVAGTLDGRIVCFPLPTAITAVLTTVSPASSATLEDLPILPV